MIEKILNNTTPYGKIRASHEGSLHSSTLTSVLQCVYLLVNKVAVLVSCVTRKCSIAAESHIRSHYHISSKIQLFW